MSSSPLPWPAGYGRQVLAETDSTNSEGARIAGSLVVPTWILALRQTAGRGRRGRPWTDPGGTFTATLVMRPQGGAAEAAQRSFVAALALYDALVLATGRAEALSLKWPNDVLLNGGKVAGILLESAGQGGRMSPLCIGIGVNLVSAPDAAQLEPGAVAPTSVLSATGARLTPEDFLDLLAPCFAAWEAKLTTFGFDPLRMAFLDRAARRGEVVTARTGRETLTGTFADIDATGALILRTSKGPVAVAAADVYF